MSELSAQLQAEELELRFDDLRISSATTDNSLPKPK